VSTSTHLITYEESLLMSESNLEEVIDGELRTMPPATKSAIVDRAAWKSDLRATSDPYSHIVPELAIEVASPANRKGALQQLLQNYADFGIPEVLLFYPESRTYESYQGTTLVDTAQAGTVSPRTMPNVSIDLDRLGEEF
jgi:Uma2 family endonuclease